MQLEEITIIDLTCFVTVVVSAIQVKEHKVFICYDFILFRKRIDLVSKLSDAANHSK